MNKRFDDAEDILKALDDERPVKKPRNQVWLAILFADLIFFLLDLGSGLGVAYLTGVPFYGIVVFAAGFVPLLLHQKLYVRAYASEDQKRWAMIGGFIAVGSVLIVAIFIAIIRFAVRDETALGWMEAALATALVSISFVHAMIAVYYFHIDEGISENQKTNRMLARGDRSVTRIKAAQQVAQAKRREVLHRRRLEDMFTPAVVAKILAAFDDDDGDGIPNILDRRDNRVFLKDTDGHPNSRQGTQD